MKGIIKVLNPLIKFMLMSNISQIIKAFLLFADTLEKLSLAIHVLNEQFQAALS